MTRTDSRVPVIEHADELNIPWHTLQTIIAGRSLIDTFELHINSLEEAERFLQAYGLECDDEPEELRGQALEYIETVLLQESQLRLPGSAGRLLKQIRDIEAVAPRFRDAGLIKPVSRPAVIHLNVSGIATHSCIKKALGAGAFGAIMVASVGTAAIPQLALPAGPLLCPKGSEAKVGRDVSRSSGSGSSSTSKRRS